MSELSKYEIEVDLSLITIDDALIIEDFSRKAKDPEYPVKVFFRDAIAVLDKCCKVKGLDSVKLMKFDAVNELMEAFSAKISGGAGEAKDKSNPTTA